MEKKRKKIQDTPSSTPVMSSPDTATEMVNKYGTYEIQPTADTDNIFPTIAQGLPKTDIVKDLEK